MGAVGIQPTPASAAPPIGTLKVWAGGVPSHLGTGGTIDLTIYYSQNSPDTLSPVMFAVSLWDTTAPGDAVVSASWLNPQTQSWQESTRADSRDWILDMSTSQPRLNVPPNTTASVRVRLTFAPSTRPGTYRLQVMPALSYQLFNPQGVNVPETLNYNWPQYNIPYGTAAAPATPQATRPAPAGQAPKPTTPLPSVTQSPSPATSPAAESATPSESASASPAAATVEIAAHETRSRSVWPYVGALVAAALLAAGGYRLRRRHADGWTSSEPEHVPSPAETHPHKAED